MPLGPFSTSRARCFGLARGSEPYFDDYPETEGAATWGRYWDRIDKILIAYEDGEEEPDAKRPKRGGIVGYLMCCNFFEFQAAAGNKGLSFGCCSIVFGSGSPDKK